MRKLIFGGFACLLLNSSAMFAQNTMGLENDLKGVMATGASARGTVMSAFNSSAVKGSRYLVDTWTPGSVVSVTGEVYSAGYSFNFDKINQDIYAMHTNTDFSVMLDKSKVKRFTIGSSSFVNAMTLNPANPLVFYQVLVEDSNKINLYKLIATKFVKANPNDIMNARTGNLSNEYVDEYTYYLGTQKGGLKKTNLTQNSIRKVLKEQADKVEAYFNGNSTKDIDEVFLVGLIKNLNLQ